MDTEIERRGGDVANQATNERVFDPIREVIAAIGRGEMVVMVDDEDRENEGDLVVAAEHATSDVVAFMITHARGLVCLTLTAGRARELDLPPMVAVSGDHRGTAFTVSIDGTPANGVTTGISAAERATTIALAVTGSADDLQRPGTSSRSSRGMGECSFVPGTPRPRST